MSTTAKSVLVVEDDAPVSEAICARLREHGYDVQAVATFAMARAAKNASRFDVAVLDVQLPDGNGLDLLPLPVPSLVLTVFDDEATWYRALVRGANGYLVKPEGIATIANAIGDLLAGGSPISPRIARWLLDDFRAAARMPPTADVESLTAREQAVVEYFATGATYAEIARAMGITINTVRTHVRSIYEKLHVASKTEAVLKVMPHAYRLSR